DLNMVIKPMAETGQEPIGSMGDDEQPAAISYKPQLLFRYFKQLFAQVTNPPIDPYRENLVMSLMSFTGAEYNLLEEGPLHCRQLKLSHPVLSNKDIQKILYRKGGGLGAQRVDMLFEAGKGSAAMEKALEALCAESEKKIDEGNSIIILSDRNSDSNYAPLPSLLAVSVVNNYLTAKGKRHLAGLIIESGEAREVTDFALLIGFGASAVNPYLALDTVSSLCEKSIISGPAKAEDALDNYITAVKKGLLKIMSKMGISTIRSYKFAQIFEAVGLNSEFTNKYFPGLNSPVEGVGIKKIYNDYSQMHKKACNCALNESISSGGRYLYRKNSVKHLLTPDVVIRFRQAVMKGDYEKYKEFSQLIDSSEITLRNFLNFKSSKAIPLEKVEKESSILKRFYSCAMSFGSISKEAHETIAVAMNRLGCSSNSGEGGEDSKRYNTEKNSAVKQVASGRFGVNINYLANAKELQIKMAQGAKPGEGGQLPGHKVDEEIAGVRNSTPGVMLISPPPHHDIYSIEDLAQLIYDLKSANTSARVSVKLVSESGVGTIAAGVAKAGADMVLISGGDGGTGASPISSIKNAGIPWEIGLSETHQTLVLNNLRNRLRLQVDGQIRTGRDVVMGALMGAEEFGFGTAALMTMGCVMVRHCHSNTCPVGVATQDPVLRKRFMGKPEYLMNYLTFVARHTREIMARLGFKNIDDMVGRAEKLIPSQKADGKGFDFSKLLACPGDRKKSVMIFSSETRKDNKEKSLNKTILNDTMSRIKNLNGKKSFSLNYSIKNRDRSVGAQLSGEIAKKYGLKGLGDKNIKVSFRGSAGQSFAAFLSKGLFFSLEGDANDYLAKGLSGGVVTLFPDRNSSFEPSENTISGNVNLFGATSGELYVNGQAGERFGARNSGARAVVEGVGDHGCEYMTGGRVVVLGKTGVNFGAGMSGGIAYVYDRDRLFDTRCNREMVELESLKDKDDIEGLLLMLKKHYNYTRSGKAKSIIEDFNRSLSFFVKVMPLDYKKALAAIREKENRESEREIITEEIY
ncbi:MAG: glutamate synthase large subunit, partial [Elusimicrobiota bacterium]